MRNRIEIRLEVRIDNPMAFKVEPLIDLPQGLVSTLARPKPIREIPEARFEQRFENDLHCCLNYTISNDRYTERSLRSVGLRDEHPSDRQRLVPFPNKLFANIAQKGIDSHAVLNFRERLSIYTRSALIGSHLSVCRAKHIFATHLVIQHSEFTCRIRLGCQI